MRLGIINGQIRTNAGKLVNSEVSPECCCPPPPSSSSSSSAPECVADEDCPIGCAEGEHLVYDAGGQPYCCPEGRDYIGDSGGFCLLVPQGTPGDQDIAPASGIIVQCCCDGVCAPCPCPECTADSDCPPAGYVSCGGNVWCPPGTTCYQEQNGNWKCQAFPGDIMGPLANAYYCCDGSCENDYHFVPRNEVCPP